MVNNGIASNELEKITLIWLIFLVPIIITLVIFKNLYTFIAFVCWLMFPYLYMKIRGDKIKYDKKDSERKKD